jgi:hypothetical protein
MVRFFSSVSFVACLLLMHQCVTTAQMELESVRTADVLIQRKTRSCFHRLERTPFRDARNVKQLYIAPEHVKRSTGVLTSWSVVV